MSFELFVAFRYLLARRKQAFISVISFISTLGVAVGVMAVVIALALMTGLQGELRDRILGSMGHVYVWKTGGIEDYRAEVTRLLEVSGVRGAAPAIDGRALIVAHEAQAFISLKGIDPQLEATVTDIQRTLQQGRIEDLQRADEGGPPGILIGRELAQTLGVRVGDPVSLITQQGTLSPMGVLPRSRPARVAGIFALGLQEFDTMYGFVSLDFASRLTGTQDLRIQLRVDDINEAPAIAQNVMDTLGSSYIAQDWSDLNASLFSALWIEKMAISIAIGLIVVVAALQILCHNENSTYVLRHGERECSVRVRTDDGHTIEWRRKSAPSYIIDGQVFDRLRRGGPLDELADALRLPKVQDGSDVDADVAGVNGFQAATELNQTLADQLKR